MSEWFLTACSRRLRTVALVLLPWAVGCAAESDGDCSSPGGDTRLERLFVAEEIGTLNAVTALDVIRSLRPDLLEDFVPTRRTYGVMIGIGAELAVSMDGGTPLPRRHLESIPAATIHRLEWLDRCQARDEFRGGYPKGVVRISTR